MNVLIVYDPTSKEIEHTIHLLKQKLSQTHTVHMVKAGKEIVTNIIQYDFVITLIPQWNFWTKRNIKQFFKQHEFPLYTPSAFIINGTIRKETITDHVTTLLEESGLNLISTYTLDPPHDHDEYQEQIDTFTVSLYHDLCSYKNA